MNLKTTIYDANYKFIGKERDMETGFDYFGARYYSNSLGVWLSVDPLADARAWSSPYSYCQNNPVGRVDDSGMLDDIVVTTNNGKELFRLNDGKKKITTMTARQLYAQGTQWFEPTADNYMPLISVSPNIKEYEELKHFSWQQITTFATQDRSMFAYRAGGSGDWKAEGKPGDGYLMVTVDGMPYWADAIGQIPFAVNNFKNELGSTNGNVNLAKQRTIATGQQYGDGSVLGGQSDCRNSYDNAMIRRATNWSENYFYYNSNKGRVSRRYYPSQELSKPSNIPMLKMY